MIDLANTTGETWLSQTELAKLRGVSKVSISKRMRRLAAEGRLEVREHRGKSLCRLTDWERETGERTDPERLGALVAGGEMAPPRAAAPVGSEPGLTAARTVTERYRGELAKLDYETRIGRLMEAADVQQAVTRAAEVIVRTYNQLPEHAEDLAAALTLGGVAGLRKALAGLVHDMRATTARAFKDLAAGVAALEDEDEDDDGGDDPGPPAAAEAAP